MNVANRYLAQEADLWREEPRVVNGAIDVPNRPGHGMEFSEKAMRDYLVK